jgi:putative transposase
LTNPSGKIALDARSVLQSTIKCLSENILLKTRKQSDTQKLWQILVGAASKGDTIEQTAKELKTGYHSNTIRYHLSKLKNFSETEKEVNQALKTQINKGIKKKKQSMAIDFNLLPYYGEPNEDEKPYICRSQAKLGTCSFYGYATLYLIKKGKRVTLALRGIRFLETKVAILTYLLAELSSFGIRVKRLLLDREFFSVAVIRWLKGLGIPFIMPAIRRGKKGGIKQFLKGRKSYKTTYTMSDKSGRPVTFILWITCHYLKGKRKKKGIVYQVYVVYKIKTSLNYLPTLYRRSDSGYVFDSITAFNPKSLTI